MATDAWTSALEMAETLNAGDCLSYEDADDLGDMAMDELVRRLRSRGLQLSHEDTDCVWVEDIDGGA